MGFPKYFEDIQKLRDRAAHLHADRMNLNAAASNPKKAIEELLRVQEQLRQWSTELLGQLDSILDQATDPEVNRQKLLEAHEDRICELELQLRRCSEDCERLRRDLHSSEEAGARVQQRLDQEKASRLVLEKGLDEARKSAIRIAAERDYLLLELRRINTRSNESKAFDALMKQEGTKPLRK